jgi:hypothetical protein
MLVDLKQRLAKFKLVLHEERRPVWLSSEGCRPSITSGRGARRLATFAFLGFVNYCGWTRDGRFVVKRKAQGKPLTTKLKLSRYY